MITNWSYSINKGVKKLADEDGDVKDDLAELDVSVYPCSRQATEIAKNIRLCMEKGQAGSLPMSGSCYVVKVDGACNFNTPTFQSALVSMGLSASILDNQYTIGDSKIYIAYSYGKKQVKLS